MTLEQEYTTRYRDVLIPLAANLEDFIRSRVVPTHPRIERVSARAKSIERFLDKANKAVDGLPKYGNPLKQIQDQIGARITVFYLKDVDAVAEQAKKFFNPIEEKQITPDSESEFGYFGKHFIFLLPLDVFSADMDRSAAPSFFELQIKTLFQHAWSEANHDLGYKPSALLTTDQKRRIAFTSAQAWGADRIFNELHSEV